MRWQELFADLEGQSRAWERAELENEISDRTRAETGQLLLVNRLRHWLGGPVRLTVLGAGSVSGTLERVGADWLLVHGPTEEVVTVNTGTQSANSLLNRRASSVSRCRRPTTTKTTAPTAKTASAPRWDVP